MATAQYNWNYGVALSGLMFPMITTSGTTALSIAPTNFSTTISKNGGAFAACANPLASSPTGGRGMYNIAGLTATEMTCYTWCVNVSLISGAQDTYIFGTNVSGLAGVDIAANASSLAVYVSGIPGIAASVSGLNTSSLIAQCSSIWGNTSNVLANQSALQLATNTNMSAMAVNVSALGNVASLSTVCAQTWNTLTATYTSSTTFGGVVGGGTYNVNVSNVAAQIWNSLPATYNSSLTFGAVLLSGQYATVSGLANILSAVSGLNTSNLIAQVSSVLNAVSSIIASVNYSSVANQVWNTLLTENTSSLTFGGAVLLSGGAGILANTSSLIAQVSSVLNAVSSVSATVNYSGIASQVWNSLQATYTSNTTFGVVATLTSVSALGNVAGISSVANQVWNTLQAENTSTTTFGGALQGSISVNTSAIAGQVWNTVTLTATSSTTFGGSVATLTSVSALLNVYSIDALASGVWGYSVGSSRWITGGVINSGPSASVDYSGIAGQVWNTLTANNTSATTFGGLILLSGDYAVISGLNNIMAAVSGLNTSNLIAQASSILNAVSSVTATVNYSSVANQVWNTLQSENTSSTTFGGGILLSGQASSVNLSGIASQVWNSLPTTYNSSLTFGGGVLLSGGYTTVSGLANMLSTIPVTVASGFAPILTAVSGIVLATASGFLPILSAVSGINTSNLVAQCSSIFFSTSGFALRNDVSGLAGILTAVSAVPMYTASGVAGWFTGDNQVLASGTLAYDIRVIQRTVWGNMNIDNSYSPVRMYITDDNNNLSGYWNLTQNAQNTVRTRGNF